MTIDRSTIAFGAHATAWGTLLVTTYLVRSGALGSGASESFGAVLGFAVFAALAVWSGGQLVDRLGGPAGSWGRPSSHRPVGAVVGGLPVATASQLEASRSLGYFGATTITPTDPRSSRLERAAARVAD